MNNSLVDDYVSQAEMSGNVENWIQEHFDKSEWKSNYFAIDLPAGKPNDKYYRRFYFYTQLCNILSDITLAKTSVCLKHLHRLQLYDKANLEYFVVYMLEAVCENSSCGLAYARLCQEMLSECQEMEPRPEFLKIIAAKCQIYFNKDTFGYSGRHLKIMEIKLCRKFFLKLRLIEELDKYDTELSKKYLSLIMFFGELFLRHLLSETLIMKFVQKLSNRGTNESIECLCTLLFMIGKKIELNGCDLSEIIQKMHRRVDNNFGNITQNVWVMANRLIDLRNSRWMTGNETDF